MNETNNNINDNQSLNNNDNDNSNSLFILNRYQNDKYIDQILEKY